MEWLKENYERALAASAGFFLFLCLVFIFFGARNFRDRQKVLQSAPPPNDTIPRGKSIEVAAAVPKLAEPAQWKTNSWSGLFVPEKYFIGPNGEPTALQDALLHPPVPNAWLEEYSLP